MQSYLSLLRKILKQGVDRPNRTGVNCRSLFGPQIQFNIKRNFPLLTTKKVHFRSLVYELLWFLRGDTNIKYLREKGVRIWNEWANRSGDLGPIYGEQWRNWKTPEGRYIDQITHVVKGIKTNPFSRRHIVVAYNPGELSRMALPPCHAMFQFYVSKDGYLSCKLYQRSADAFLGVPFNIASYSLLTLMVSKVCSLKPGFFIHTFGDIHIYHNHFEAVKLQLSRKPYPPPKIKLNPVKSLFEYTYEDIQLQNYQYHPTIKAAVAV